MQLQIDHRNAFLRLLRQEFSAEIVGLSLLEDNGTAFAHCAVTIHSPKCETFHMPRNPTSFCSQVAVQAQPLVVSNFSQMYPSEGCPMMRAEGLESYLGVPLFMHQHVVGALEIMVKEIREWVPDDVRKLEDFARIFLLQVDRYSEPERPALKVVR